MVAGKRTGYFLRHGQSGTSHGQLVHPNECDVDAEPTLGEHYIGRGAWEGGNNPQCHQCIYNSDCQLHHLVRFGLPDRLYYQTHEITVIRSPFRPAEGRI